MIGILIPVLGYTTDDESMVCWRHFIDVSGRQWVMEPALVLKEGKPNQADESRLDD